MSPAVLIAGIGNIFHRDDGFGVEVASRLGGMRPADGVRVVDFGIRGFDLVLALLESHGLIIFVDAVSRGGAPGTVYVIEPDLTTIPEEQDQALIENAHGLDPMKVLAMAASLGATPGRVIVVGCEPELLGDDTGRIGLTETVQAAVEPAIEVIGRLVQEYMATRKAVVE